jgi:hypothetical protein
MNLGNLASLASALALVVVSAAINSAGAQTPAAAPARVVKLRIDNVALYDQPNGKKVGEYRRGEFKGPWPVVARSDKGFLQVQVDGSTYWVRSYAVETDVPFRVPADCGAVVAANQPKVGATRGVGEECTPPAGMKK